MPSYKTNERKPENDLPLGCPNLTTTERKNNEATNPTLRRTYKQVTHFRPATAQILTDDNEQQLCDALCFAAVGRF